MIQTYRGCHHKNRIFLVTYKPQIYQGVSSEESPKLLCSECRNNPDFVNDGITDIIFNIETGAILN